MLIAPPPVVNFKDKLYYSGVTGAVSLEGSVALHCALYISLKGTLKGRDVSHGCVVQYDLCCAALNTYKTVSTVL